MSVKGTPDSFCISVAQHAGDAGEEFETTVLSADKLDDGFIRVREGKSIAKFV
jgi:hypothetical protein